ncbi:MAG: hydrogenase maturation nickel metallochaperone HypA [bacterium]
MKESAIHEVGIAESIMQITRQVAEQNNMIKVTSLLVEIGQFSGVEPHALEFAWEFVSKGTVAEGSTLEIERPPLVLFCTHCLIEYPGDMEDLRCPNCKDEVFEIRKGREMLVRSISGDKKTEKE